MRNSRLEQILTRILKNQTAQMRREIEGGTQGVRDAIFASEVLVDTLKDSMRHTRGQNAHAPQ